MSDKFIDEYDSRLDEQNPFMLDRETESYFLYKFMNDFHKEFLKSNRRVSIVMPRHCGKTWWRKTLEKYFKS
jgi:hypothetical protein